MSGARIHANEVQKTTEPVRQPGQERIRQQERGPVQAVAPQVAYRRVQLNRNGLRPADLLALQRAVGNRMVQRMVAQANDEQQDDTAEEDSERTVQTKLTVGAPEDVYEQEVDRVAGQVMTMPDAAAQQPNRTGLPDGLRSGIESLSGISMDGVNVHYNSSLPARLNALAYAQGSDIHVAPGQTQHLPHEAWHVVQQAQGRVQPTVQMEDGVPVNDDASLEHEADVMGARAAQMRQHAATMTGTVAEPGLAAQTGEASQVSGEALGAAKEKGRLNFLSTTRSPRQVAQRRRDGLFGPATSYPGTAGSAGPVVQGNFWELLAAPFRAVAWLWGGGAAPAGPAVAPNAVPVVPVAVAPPQREDFVERLRQAEGRMEAAARSLPPALQDAFDAQGMPGFLENDLHNVTATVRDQAVPLNVLQAQADAARLEQLALDYGVFCTAVAPALARVARSRADYGPQLTPADHALVGTIAGHVVHYTATAAQVQGLCTQFVEAARARSAMTGAQLLTLLHANEARASQLVTAWFNDGRLRVGPIHGIYPTEWDGLTGHFGAEMYLLARDEDLADVAAVWVFHTHAYRVNDERFELKRGAGANHLKPKANPLGPDRVNFHSPAEFERIEASADMQKSFNGWSRRKAEVLGNQNKRK